MSSDGAPAPGHAFMKPLLPARKDSRTSMGEASPSRPPVSPITPSASLARLASAQASVHPPLSPQVDGAGDDRPAALPSVSLQPSQPPAPTPNQPPPQAHPSQTPPIPPPQPAPFEEDDNTDAIALRATLSILQHQKQTSERDIKALQQLKRSLRDDPSSFTEALVAGKMREEKRPDDPLHATFATDDVEENDTMNDGEPANDTPQSQMQYPKIPTQQNVIRCPPINWAKYHIVGEPLDRMHEEQRKKPSHGEPSHGSISQSGNPYHTASMGPPDALAPEHHIYKPYDPFTDSLAERDGVQTRRSSKLP